MAALIEGDMHYSIEGTIKIIQQIEETNPQIFDKIVCKKVYKKRVEKEI